MSTIGETEKHTQQRVIDLFKDALDYTYLGNWADSVETNTNIVKENLANWLQKQGHDSDIIAKTVHQLKQAAAIGGSRTLYDANLDVYNLLRYGVRVLPDVGKQYTTVWLIDWHNPHNNHFGIAQEVALSGTHPKRPDLVLYINGIAIGVLELKRSTVSVSEGIRQNLENQKERAIGKFFTTVQLVMAGNETQGLRYNVIETPERYWLHWKEENTPPNTDEIPLHTELSHLCNKERMLEILHNFIVFDARTKKICRHNQYFGVKAAQKRVRSREGGIIWHTQGSGKSLTMVWLAKWILENNPHARVLIITDRTELDEQIERVFQGVKENIKRTKSGEDLAKVLRNSSDRLACSLVHKFGRSGEIDDTDVDIYVIELQQNLSDDLRAADEFFVFVDECHRTQSGKLHKAMKELLPNAMLIGFTGTPLLKSDKQRSIETFGTYIHTYKYDEAVQDGVVLDLRYEPRDIDQNITSQEQIDQFFDNRTSGLNDVAKAQLKQRWGTMLNVESSMNRLRKIVADIILDMETRDRLKSGRGNAILVANSILSACRFYNLFQETPLQGKCAIITSYRPTIESIRLEETGEGFTDNQQLYNTYQDMLAAYFGEPFKLTNTKVDQFEQEVKKSFIDEPAKMKLLIVVDKLLTGFDAPPATYLYIDKNMQDHGLFQAICRVNRLDGDDKEFGYIVDYKDLFQSLGEAITSYTSDAFENYDREDVKGLLKDRLKKGKERLEETHEAIKALCEPVAPPKNTHDYIRYFCGDRSDAQLRAKEQLRIKLYKMTAAFVRAYANLANEMEDAGYSLAEAEQIKEDVTRYEKIRKAVKLASGDYVDLKVYEPDMRHLLDTYIQAEDSKKLPTFDGMPLVQLIVQNGIDAVIEGLPEGVRNDQEAIAATIENNVRRLIVDKSEINPRYYENMSRLLDDLIHERRQGAMDYRTYLSKMAGLSTQVADPSTSTDYPAHVNSGAQRALYDNLGDIPDNRKLEITLALDDAIIAARMDNWRGHTFRERQILFAIERVITDTYSDCDIDVDAIFELVKNQQEYQ